MRHLDLADLVALAAEVSEVEAPKLLELLDTSEIAALVAPGHARRPPHQAAAVVLVGIAAAAPLPTGSRRLALLAASQLLAVNGLEATLDPEDTRRLLADVATGEEDASLVAAWLDRRVTARDPLEGTLRKLLAPDAWRAIGLTVLSARRHGRRLATSGDLLVGLLGEGTGPGALALGADGRGSEVVSLPPRPPLPARVPAFEPDVRKVLELAFRASVALGHPEINSGHLLLELLDGGTRPCFPRASPPRRCAGRSWRGSSPLWTTTTCPAAWPDW